MTIEQILQEVALMPASTRAYIAEKILEMIDAEEQIDLSPEWISLIEKRVADIDAGAVQMVKADDVMKQIGSELK